MVVGEDLAHGLLVRVGHLAIGEDQIEVLVLRVAGDGFAGPLVLVAGVVEDEVHDEADAGQPQIGRERGQVVHGAERRVHPPVARHRVPAVGVALRALEQRHQVQVGQAELFEVRDAVAHTLETARVPVHVADAAEHLVRQIPVRVLLPQVVARLQLERTRGPRGRGLRDDRRKLLETVVARAVELDEERMQRREVRGEAPGERSVERADGFGRDAPDLVEVACPLGGESRHDTPLCNVLARFTIGLTDCR